MASIFVTRSTTVGLAAAAYTVLEQEVAVAVVEVAGEAGAILAVGLALTQLTLGMCSLALRALSASRPIRLDR